MEYICNRERRIHAGPKNHNTCGSVSQAHVCDVLGSLFGDFLKKGPLCIVRAQVLSRGPQEAGIQETYRFESP